VKDWLEQDKPYLGICLGLQVGVKAAGGEVIPGAVTELGFRDQTGALNVIDLTDEGFADSLFAGLNSPFKVFHLHGETVELTDDMELLGTGEDCLNQAVKIGPRAYGLQCHFELTDAMLERWLAEDDDLQGMDTEQLRSDWQTIKTEYAHTGRILLNNFLELAAS
jgi:GMP synthase-like glutamine amidotransferase